MSAGLTSDVQLAADGVLAMHISNGIIDGPVSAAAGLLAVAAVAYGVVRGRRDLDDRHGRVRSGEALLQAPLTG